MRLKWGGVPVRFNKHGRLRKGDLSISMYCKPNGKWYMTVLFKGTWVGQWFSTDRQENMDLAYAHLLKEFTSMGVVLNYDVEK